MEKTSRNKAKLRPLNEMGAEARKMKEEERRKQTEAARKARLGAAKRRRTEQEQPSSGEDSGSGSGDEGQGQPSTSTEAPHSINQSIRKHRRAMKNDETQTDLTGPQIAQLQQERDDLRAERDHLRAQCDHLRAECDKLRADVKQVRQGTRLSLDQANDARENPLLRREVTRLKEEKAKLICSNAQLSTQIKLSALQSTSSSSRALKPLENVTPRHRARRISGQVEELKENQKIRPGSPVAALIARKINPPMAPMDDLMMTTWLNITGKQRERLKRMLIRKGYDFFAPTTKVKQLKKQLTNVPIIEWNEEGPA